MSSTILDKLAARAKVRVYKSAPNSDDRATLCGEPLQQGVNVEGEPAHYWDIPSHQADYIDGAFAQYTVSDPFIPGEEPTFTPGDDCQCDLCDFIAKTPAGLGAHKRKVHP